MRELEDSNGPSSTHSVYVLLLSSARRLRYLFLVVDHANGSKLPPLVFTFDIVGPKVLPQVSWLMMELHRTESSCEDRTPFLPQGGH